MFIPFPVTLQDLYRYDKQVPRLGLPEWSRRKHVRTELYWLGQPAYRHERKRVVQVIAELVTDHGTSTAEIS